MEYVIEKKYPVEAIFEISVNFDGFNYLVIYGKHINGGFCAIPNWNFSCELGEPDDTFYTQEQLKRKFNRKTAQAIAYAIRDAAELEG